MKIPSNLPYTIQTCDGGNHRRKDRLHGGMYITKGVVSMALSTMQPNETVIIQRKPRLNLKIRTGK